MTSEARRPLHDVWVHYRATGDPDSRETLILGYLPLVQQIAGRLPVHLPVGVDREDLAGYGTEGLIDAIDRFDPDQDVKFESFAAQRIRGAMLDQLRRADPLARRERKRVKEIAQATSDLTQNHGRAPTEDELSEHLGLTLAQLRGGMQAAAVVTFSLNDVLRGDDENGPLTLADLVADPHTPDPLDAVEHTETVHAVKRAISRMSERDRTILSLHYQGGQSMAAIGRVLDVSPRWAHDLHLRAIDRLRSLSEYRSVWSADSTGAGERQAEWDRVRLSA